MVNRKILVREDLPLPNAAMPGNYKNTGGTPSLVGASLANLSATLKDKQRIKDIQEGKEEGLLDAEAGMTQKRKGTSSRTLAYNQSLMTAVAAQKDLAVRENLARIELEAGDDIDLYNKNAGAYVAGFAANENPEIRLAMTNTAGILVTASRQRILRQNEKDAEATAKALLDDDIGQMVDDAGNTVRAIEDGGMAADMIEVEMAKLEATLAGHGPTVPWYLNGEKMAPGDGTYTQEKIISELDNATWVFHRERVLGEFSRSDDPVGYLEVFQEAYETNDPAVSDLFDRKEYEALKNYMKGEVSSATAASNAQIRLVEATFTEAFKDIGKGIPVTEASQDLMGKAIADLPADQQAAYLAELKLVNLTNSEMSAMKRMTEAERQGVVDYYKGAAQAEGSTQADQRLWETLKTFNNAHENDLDRDPYSAYSSTNAIEQPPIYTEDGHLDAAGWTERLAIAGAAEYTDGRPTMPLSKGELNNLKYNINLDPRLGAEYITEMADIFNQAGEMEKFDMVLKELGFDNPAVSYAGQMIAEGMVSGNKALVSAGRKMFEGMAMVKDDPDRPRPGINDVRVKMEEFVGDAYKLGGTVAAGSGQGALFIYMAMGGTGDMELGDNEDIMERAIALATGSTLDGGGVQEVRGFKTYMPPNVTDGALETFLERTLTDDILRSKSRTGNLGMDRTAELVEEGERDPTRIFTAKDFKDGGYRLVAYDQDKQNPGKVWYAIEDLNDGMGGFIGDGTGQPYLIGLDADDIDTANRKSEIQYSTSPVKLIEEDIKSEIGTAFEAATGETIDQFAANMGLDIYKDEDGQEVLDSGYMGNSQTPRRNNSDQQWDLVVEEFRKQHPGKAKGLMTIEEIEAEAEARAAKVERKTPSYARGWAG